MSGSSRSSARTPSRTIKLSSARKTVILLPFATAGTPSMGVHSGPRPAPSKGEGTRSPAGAGTRAFHRLARWGASPPRATLPGVRARPRGGPFRREVGNAVRIVGDVGVVDPFGGRGGDDQAPVRGRHRALRPAATRPAGRPRRPPAGRPVPVRQPAEGLGRGRGRPRRRL